MGFTLKAGEAIRIAGQRLGKQLYGDVATELRVASSIDLSHPSLPERGEDLEHAEASSG